MKDSNDIESMTKLAEIYKIPPDMLKLILSIIKMETKNIIDSLKGLVAQDPFRLPPNVVDFIVSLIFNDGQF